ncbi:MAG: fibronectin type III domain-containing protein, partial [Nitrospira sp.]|nr:fibronectin type III domain-containing protein [Nitrospira sp.]
MTLAWKANREPDLAGYKLYIGTASGRYDFAGSPFFADIATSYIVSNLTKGQTYFFALSAYDSAGNESVL